MIYWPKNKKVAMVPAPLMVVLAGVGLSALFVGTEFALQINKLYSIPMVKAAGEFFALFKSRILVPLVTNKFG
jgi:hypothetical protein